MALPNTNISVPMVRDELGAATNDVGQLCIHPNINKWSKWKPVRHSSINPITEAQLISVSCGLQRHPQVQGQIGYEKPRGGGAPHNEPYRLGDFINYNHNAKVPIYPEIISINGATTPQVGEPWTLVVGLTYTINFKLIIGDINPQWIDPITSRFKNTDPEGGYGGLTWVIETPDITQYDVMPEKVFSTEIFGETYSQTITIKNNPLRMEYVRYKGNTQDMYQTINRWIEDDYGLPQSYRRQVNIITMDIVTSIPLLSFIFSNIQGRTTTYNNMSTTSMPVRIKYSYNYQLASEYPNPLPPGTVRLEQITDIGNIAPGSSQITSTNLTSPPATTGTYQYFGFIYTEVQVPNGDYIVVSQTQFSQQIILSGGGEG